jgi:hypothetical protein
MKWSHVIVACVGLIGFSRSAFGQDNASRPRVWDGGASVGVAMISSVDIGDDARQTYLQEQIDVRAEIGRYWTPHVKTELSINPPAEWTSGIDLSVPGVPFLTAYRTVKLTFVTPTLTYQFRDNAFLHPYVSAGARIGIGTVRTVQPFETVTINKITYTVPTIDEESRTVQVRPFVAVGAKAYLTRRTYVRPEALLAFSEAGMAQILLRLGLGVDF